MEAVLANVTAIHNAKTYIITCSSQSFLPCIARVLTVNFDTTYEQYLKQNLTDLLEIKRARCIVVKMMYSNSSYEDNFVICESKESCINHNTDSNIHTKYGICILSLLWVLFESMENVCILTLWFLYLNKHNILQHLLHYKVLNGKPTFISNDL